MSTLRVNKLENTNTSNGGISIDTSGHVSIDGANFPTSGPLTNRNLIINGAMQVAQRGTQVTGVTTAGYRTCDRFNFAASFLGTWTVDQSTDAPSGFSNSFKVTCTTADASPFASDYLFYYHLIEAQNCQSIGFGTSDAKPLILSFWVKSNKTGNASFAIMQADNSYKLASFQYSISSADTWEYKTIAIPADTAGIMNNDNGIGLQVEWWLNSGSNFSGGSFQPTWSTYSNPNRNVSNLGVGGAVNDYWQITGVQLEVGETATPFEHRSYGDELAKCQRYFERMNYTYDAWTFIAVATVPGTSSAINMIGSIYYETKRTDPTVTSTAANTFRQNGGGVSDNVATTIGFAMETPKSCRIEAAATGIWRTSGLSGWISRQSTSTCYIDFDAEL